MVFGSFMEWILFMLKLLREICGILAFLFFRQGLDNEVEGVGTIISNFRCTAMLWFSYRLATSKCQSDYF